MKERSTLGIGLRLSSPGKVLAGCRGNCDTDSGDEEDGHDGECKNPLEGNNLSEELANTNGCGEHAEVESNGVILH